MAGYWVYILTNYRRVLYVGMTNNLPRRIYEHRNKLVKGFTSKYNVTELVYYEGADDVLAIIGREKEIKGWTRAKKFTLISSFNPSWRDLGDDVLKG